MPCRIKLCGLQTEDDVACALALGVEAVGFVLSESPRQVTPERAAALRAPIPHTVRVVAVFGPDDPAVIRDALSRSGCDVAQIAGADEDDYWQALADLPHIRAFRVRGPETLERLEAVRGREFVLDAYVPGAAGGTGAAFDWTLARQAAAYGKVILAGGLHPENVADAIRAAQPFMVDVSSGIEAEKGVKDHARMRAFVEAVRNVAIP